MPFGQLILEDGNGLREKAITLRTAAAKWRVPLPILAQAARAGELDTWVVGPGHRLTTETAFETWRSNYSGQLDLPVDRTEIPSIELAYLLTVESGQNGSRSSGAPEG